MKNTLTITALTLFIIALLASDIFAIPAFARKYNMSCKTCHTQFPALKDFGDEFAGNGFILKDQDAPRYFVDTGDEELSLIRDIPLALRLEGYLTYNNRNTEQADFTAPYLLKLLSGGSIAPDVAYYFYFFFSERGEVSGIEDAFIMFNDLFGSELDVYVGQFQVSDPLFKRELRLTYDDYEIYKTKVGSSNINLAYDRGIMITYGFESGTDITAMVLNGTGIGQANVFRNFDNDKYKNFLGRISQGIGDHLRIGGFGYWGKEEHKVYISSSEGFLFPNNLALMFGGDATISIEPLELNLQYVERNDDNPYFLHEYNIGNINNAKIKTRGGFAELIYRPEGDDSKWYSALLYNYIESDTHELDRTLRNYESLAVHLGYMLRRNIRLVAEYSHNFTNEYGRFGVGFISAF
ncbi:MAG: hypothetical protein R6W68_16630 [Ignavibacteriaceae bacterium]